MFYICIQILLNILKCLLEMNTQSNIYELISSMLDVSNIETQDQPKNKQSQQHKLEENKQINKQGTTEKKGTKRKLPKQKSKPDTTIRSIDQSKIKPKKKTKNH